MSCVNCNDKKLAVDYPFCDSNCRLVYCIRLEKSAYFPHMHKCKLGEEKLKYPEFLIERKIYCEPNSQYHKDINTKVKPLGEHMFPDFQC